MKLKKLCVFFCTALVVFLVCSSLVSAEEAAPTKLNVNTATVEQLSAVPGLTPELAQKIVDYRNEMGDITNIEELKDIEGITKDILDQIKDKVGVEGIEGSDCTC
jgi:competence protein ComEA